MVQPNLRVRRLWRYVCSVEIINRRRSVTTRPPRDFEVAYCGMIIGKRIIDTHILEEPSNVVLEEAFNLRKVELGVNEDSSNIRLDNVREALDRVSLDAVE